MPPNRNYIRGRTKEYQTQETLEKLGYKTYRSAGSKSPVDIFAFLSQNNTEQPIIRAIQVKFSKYVSKKDIQELTKLKLPAVVKKEIWHYRKYKAVRIIECNKENT